jgi:chromosome segregation ATPase
MNVKLKQACLRLAVGVGVLSAAMISAGCGIYATQTQAKLTRADAAVQEARDAKAEQLASDDLKAASSDVSAARQEFDKGDYAAAQRGAEKGLANAQVASLRAKLETTNQDIASKEQAMGQEAMDARARLEAKNSEIADLKQKIAAIDSEISKLQQDKADVEGGR